MSHHKSDNLRLDGSKPSDGTNTSPPVPSDTIEQLHHILGICGCKDKNFKCWYERTYHRLVTDYTDYDAAVNQIDFEQAKVIEALVQSRERAAELYGRLHQTIELFQQGELSAKSYSLLHEQITDKISRERLGREGQPEG